MNEYLILQEEGDGGARFPGSFFTSTDQCGVYLVHSMMCGEVGADVVFVGFALHVPPRQSRSLQKLRRASTHQTGEDPY